MQYRLKDSINDYIGQLDKANDDFESALEIISAVKEELETDNWQGESKEAILAVLSVFKEYHGKVLSVVKDNSIAMKAFSDNASNYMSSGNVPSMWK